MNKIRLILTMVVIFVLTSFIGYFIHEIWLKPDYLLAAAHFRPEGQEKLPAIFLANFAFAAGSVWLYAHGVQDKPVLLQGVRFGIAICLVLVVPLFLISYATQPIPALMVSKQMLSEFVAKIFLGVITAVVYGKGPKPVTPASIE